MTKYLFLRSKNKLSIVHILFNSQIFSIQRNCTSLKIAVQLLHSQKVDENMTGKFSHFLIDNHIFIAFSVREQQITLKYPHVLRFLLSLHISLKAQVKLRFLCTIYNKIFSILFPRKVGLYTSEIHNIHQQYRQVARLAISTVHKDTNLSLFTMHNSPCLIFSIAINFQKSHNLYHQSCCVQVEILW